MSLKRRLKHLEYEISQSRYGGAYPLCVLSCDTTISPPEYWEGIDRETGKIITEAEAERFKEDFYKRNSGRYALVVQITVDNSPITDSDDY